jgi:RHS repeat-associated protein
MRPLLSVVAPVVLLTAGARTAARLVAVVVAPDNGPHPDPTNRLAQSTNDTVKFTVKNTGTIDTRYAITCARSGNVTAITTCASPPNPIIANGDSVIVPVVFSVGAVGTGRVSLTATSIPPNAGATATGGWDITIVGPTVVLPKDSLSTLLPGASNNRAMFRVKNNRSISGTYHLTRVCSAAATSCSTLSPDSLIIPAFGLDSSLVTYTASGVVGDTGRVRLIASAGGGVPDDTGSVRVVLTNAMTAPVIDAANYNPGRVLARDQCVTIALSEESAAECGDLRTIYRLPMFRVLNVTRQPTLVYNSATAQPVPEVEIKVTIPALTQVPDYVEAVLLVGATVRGRQRWVGGPWNSQGVPRFIRVRDTVTPASATGLVNYTVQVNSIRNGLSTLTSSTTQPVLVVNRKASPYGNGWWIAGLEQLFIASPDTLIWVGGDGSAKVYARPSGSSSTVSWVAPTMTHADTVRPVGSNFVRLLPDSVWVWFGASGRHDSTRNRQGHVTTFAYDGSGRLQTIGLPKPNPLLASAYTFSYGSSYYIVTEGWRPQTTIWETSGRVDSIIGPRAPKDAIRYGYVPGTDLLLQRTDRRGAIRRFDIDALGKVRGARLGPVFGSGDPTDSIITAVVPAEALGFSTGGSVDSVGLHTSYDGPRRPPPAPGGVFDTTAFWVNRFGAPIRIVNALGDSTRLDRANATFPGLVTRLKTATGQVLLATYDTRGRLLSTTDSTFAMATTAYQWDTRWDQLTLVVPPENDSLFFTLNASNGDRVSQRDVRGTGSQINFSYDAATRQVNLITGPGISYQGFTYDALGDLAIVGTQSGFQRRFTQDNIGRTVLRETQIDVGASKWLQEAVTFDVGDRDSLTITRISTAPTDSQVVVRKYFDQESNLDSLTRRYKIASGMEALTTRWLRDLAARVEVEVAPDNQAETYRYDSGSNDTSMTTRRGDVISMRYDALNRLQGRTLPPYVYPSRSAHVSPIVSPTDTLSFNYTTPGSVDTLAYAADGQVVLATNRFASVARQYNPSGLLLSETLSIQKADTSGYGSHTYLTKYEYDRNRRRVSLIVPRLLKGSVTDTMRFSYTSWGAAYQTQDVSGLLYAYLYTPRSELAEIIYPGSIVHNFLYNDDGNFYLDNLVNVPGVFPRVQNANLRQQYFTSYDARAKLLASNDTTQYQDQVTANYADLGFLTKTIQTQKGLNTINGNSTNYSATDSTYVDGLGNLTRTWTSASGNSGGSGYSNNDVRNFTFQAGTGRLVHSDVSSGGGGGGGKGYVYDLAGRLVFESDSAGNGTDASENRGSFFAADGQLMAVDRRISGRRTMEDYRYDALGRRIWVRTVVTCGPLGSMECLISRVRRTVWDGGQELGEIQVPWDTANVARAEDDSSRIMKQPQCFPFADPNPFFGRVLYTPGWAVDQPLSVTRFGYNDWPTVQVGSPCAGLGSADSTWSSFTIVPHWDTRGVPTIGTFGDGAIFRPRSPWAGPCPSPYTDSTSHRCVFVTWPFGYSAYDQRRGAPVMYSWHGSLLENKRDASGFDYKRNRVYDPISGRFTQEDPIGLAGGLNAYGFASGDPVNFSDPFGLQGCKDHPNSPACKDAITSLSGLHDPILNVLLFLFTAGGSVAARAGAAGVEGTVESTGRIVIGETGKRVARYAEQVGADFFKPSEGAALRQTYEENMRWLRTALREGKEVLDIGVDPARELRGWFYRLEKELIERRGYPVTNVKP